MTVVSDTQEDLERAALVEALYRRHHYDFRGYSATSLARRLAYAREQLGCVTFGEVQDRLEHEPAVLARLVSLLTVQVSELFRDPPFFRTLREEVVPHLRTYPSLKVWVAGCGAGEEGYSLAILFREEGLEERTLFYLTDIDSGALQKAEAGIYAVDRLRRFTENHRQSGARCSLADYYTAAYGAAVFDKSLRRRMVFARHSLASDAVFAEVQLVLCRNVLIYFDRELQERALGLFRDSLVRRGFLGLGARETVRLSANRNAFEELAPAVRLYRKRSQP
jgi:chemotaxis protein methyltransferase CheR